MTAIFIGLLATAVMDAWAWIQKRLFNIPSLDYRLLGRWLLGMKKGQWQHHTIIQSPALKGEIVLGWLAHYVLGAVLAVIYCALLNEISLLSAWLWGVVTLVLPFLIMQPAFGFGFAAAKTPSPNTARWRSFVAHSSFGIGIWIAAKILGV